MHSFSDPQSSSGERADAGVPFEMRDVTRGLVGALKAVDYPHPRLVTALRRYTARARALNRERAAVAGEVERLVLQHGLDRATEGERGALVSIMTGRALALYDRPE
jgi:hypothetical protein